MEYPRARGSAGHLQGFAGKAILAGRLIPDSDFPQTAAELVSAHGVLDRIRLEEWPPPCSIIEPRKSPKLMSLYLLPAAVVGGEILDLVNETGPVAKVVLFILLAFSLISWAIILAKWSLLRRARLRSGRFMRAFRKAQRLQDVATVADQFRPSPLVGVFEGGYEEYRRQMGNTGMIRSETAIQRAMQIAASEEMTRFERNLPWLAITGAVTPFVGLFGTVWGIIDAFHGLGTAGAATLRAVAPGISEALITTAAGLAAAIPAVIAYNLIGSSIREFASRGDDFALEMLNTLETQQAARRVPETAEVRR
jgi:biopolymer transport protein TolQ